MGWSLTWTEAAVVRGHRATLLAVEVRESQRFASSRSPRGAGRIPYPSGGEGRRELRGRNVVVARWKRSHVIRQRGSAAVEHVVGFPALAHQHRAHRIDGSAPDRAVDMVPR